MPTTTPQPRVWPQCPVCGVPYVLRRGIVLRASRARDRWVWQRDCRHRPNGEPPLFTEQGETRRRQRDRPAVAGV